MLASQPKVGLQLIVFGEKARQDFEGTLQEVAAAGYSAFESGNLFAAFGEDRTRALLEKFSLEVCGAHFGYGEYADDARLEDILHFATKLGVKNLMCSGVATDTPEGYRASAERFNEVGRRCAERGLLFHYHNHDWEFKDIGGGVTGMKILSEATHPQFVRFNLDVFWLYYAGQDPAAFIRAHANRAGYFHFKDGRQLKQADGTQRPEFLELGRGEVDLKAAYAAALEVGASWIVVEQDRTALSPAESISLSRRFLREQLGI